jgi:hypothetical protein
MTVHFEGTIIKRCQCKPSERCAMCTVYTHLRKDGECAPCPKCPECLIAGLVIAAVLGCVFLKYLSAKKFNLAFINIIVDYFQVLSLFSRIKIKWPPFIKVIMEMLSFFSFNIDVASPECLVSYQKKNKDKKKCKIDSLYFFPGIFRYQKLNTNTSTTR